MNTRSYRLPAKLPRSVRSAIRRKAAAAGRLAAARADAVNRERLALLVLDLLAAGWSKADVMVELAETPPP